MHDDLTRFINKCNDHNRIFRHPQIEVPLTQHGIDCLNNAIKIALAPQFPGVCAGERDVENELAASLAQVQLNIITK